MQEEIKINDGGQECPPPHDSRSFPFDKLRVSMTILVGNFCERIGAYEPAAKPPRWAMVMRRYLWGLTGVSLMRTS
jgi:hypothetical protein